MEGGGNQYTYNELIQFFLIDISNSKPGNAHSHHLPKVAKSKEKHKTHKKHHSK